MSFISKNHIANLFYTRAVLIDKVWECQCSIFCTRNGTGFSNIMQHRDGKHSPELKTARTKFMPGQQKCLRKLLYCAKVIPIHGRFGYLKHCLYPFAVARDKDVQAHIRYERVSLSTFKLFISTPAFCVEENMSHCLLHHFANVFDRQSTSKAHYGQFLQSFPIRTSMVTAPRVWHCRHYGSKLLKILKSTSLLYSLSGKCLERLSSRMLRQLEIIAMSIDPLLRNLGFRFFSVLCTSLSWPWRKLVAWRRK